MKIKRAGFLRWFFSLLAAGWLATSLLLLGFNIATWQFWAIYLPVVIFFSGATAMGQLEMEQ